MSQPTEPQGHRQNTTGDERAPVSGGQYIPDQHTRQGDRTLDLRGDDRYGQSARDRAEFDQEFDDQSRLREQTATPRGLYDRPADRDRTVRTDAQRPDIEQRDVQRPDTERPDAEQFQAQRPDGAFVDHTFPDAGSRSVEDIDPAGSTARYPVAGPRSLVDDSDTERAMPTTIPPDRQTVAAREKERFGGMSFGSGFFGWLAATGMAVLLITLLAAAGVALGIASNDTVNRVVQDSQTDSGTAQTVGLVGGILLLVILFVAYFSGGYVAGRMARFSGAKQGLAVWLWALITTAILATIGAVAGSQYNVLAQLNLPRIPVDEGSVTTAGLIAIGAAILVALIGALLGGLAGTRFHRKVDAVGFQDDDRTF